jgi:hypothetical protein
VILPDVTWVRVDVVKSVKVLTVAPTRLAEVKLVDPENTELVKFAFVKLAEVRLQLLKTEPVKFVPDKSKEAGNVSDVYVFPWPTTIMVIRAFSMTWV